MDADEFTRLYVSSRAAVHRVASRYVTESLVADVVQTAYVKAWGARESFRGDASFSSWVCGIAARTAIDYLRRERFELCSVDVHPWARDSCEGTRELVDRVFEYARELFGSDDFVRDWYEGRSMGESALRTGLTCRQVDVRRQSLRQRLSGVAKSWGVQ